MIVRDRRAARALYVLLVAFAISHGVAGYAPRTAIIYRHVIHKRDKVSPSCFDSGRQHLMTGHCCYAAALHAMGVLLPSLSQVKQLRRA